MNFRNRNTVFADFFLQIISKISNELIYEQKSEMYSINNQYNQKNQYIVKKFQSTLTSATLKRHSQSRTEPSILSQELQPVELDPSLENFEYDHEIKGFFENIKGNLHNRAVNIVSKVFKEFEAKDLDKLSGFETNKSSVEEKKKKKERNSKKIRATSLITTKEKNSKEDGVEKRGPRKNDKNAVGEENLTKREENNENGMKKMSNFSNNKFIELDEGIDVKEEEFGKGISMKKIKRFAGEEKKDELDFGQEKNMKKRKVNEGNQKFSEFLENVEGEIKKKKNGKLFL